jgi:membrane fusion protein (multidrug efflux system)
MTPADDIRSAEPPAPIDEAPKPQAPVNLAPQPPAPIDRAAAAQPPAPAHAAAAASPPRPRWREMVIPLAVVALAIVVAAVLIGGWDRIVGGLARQSTDDAYLQSDLTPLSARIPGYIRAVHVGDYEVVHAGELIVEIEDADYRAQVAQAEANVGAVQAGIETLNRQLGLQRANIAAAEATLTGAAAITERNRLEADRQRVLLAQGLAGTRQLVEQADASFRSSTATQAQDVAQLQAQQTQLAVIQGQIAQQQANLAVARAGLDLARINLGYTRIVAPTDGMVSRRLALEGQLVSAGTQVISLVALPRIWVIANYRETQMTNIRVGQPAEVTVDAFPGVVLHGQVDSWSPASGAQFSLLPPDNATGNFTKVVQRIPVKITLDLSDPVARLLRPGMSVIATVRTDTGPTDAGPPAAPRTGAGDAGAPATNAGATVARPR